jgi:Lon protease-like protein
MNSYKLPLFPLNVVVCPKGLMNLRIFEARYLDMTKACLRENTSFGIIAALPKNKTDTTSNLPFANIGTLVDILDADVSTVGLILISCKGSHRFKVNEFTTQADGLIIGDVSDINNDLQIPIPDDLKIVSQNLQHLIESLPLQGISEMDIPIIKPYEYNDASWVSNRWTELLDLPLIQKQRLMQIDSPIVRLELIHDALNQISNKLS